MSQLIPLSSQRPFYFHCSYWLHFHSNQTNTISLLNQLTKNAQIYHKLNHSVRDLSDPGIWIWILDPEILVIECAQYLNPPVYWWHLWLLRWVPPWHCRYWVAIAWRWRKDMRCGPRPSPHTGSLNLVLSRTGSLHLV